MEGPEGIGVGIIGMGAHLPETIRTNDFWGPEWREAHAARARTDMVTGVDEAVKSRPSDVDPWVASATLEYAADLFRGAKQRRVIAMEHESSDMEVDAFFKALCSAGMHPSDVDALYGYSQLPDYPSPVNHGLVHHKLGLPLSASACTLDVGCASFLVQLATASRMVQVGEHKNAIIGVSSALSRITDYRTPASVNAGDGAVAAVIAPVEPGLGYIGQCQRTRGDLHGGVTLVPDGSDARWYESHGKRLLAHSSDRSATHTMGAYAAQMCREVCLELLDRFSISQEDIDFFVVAQATAWFGRALAEAVGIDHSKRLRTEDHYARYGHLVPASVALNLYLAWNMGRLKKGDLVLMYSPGAGYTQAAVLYRWALNPPAMPNHIA